VPIVLVNQCASVSCCCAKFTGVSRNEGNNNVQYSRVACSISGELSMPHLNQGSCRSQHYELLVLLKLCITMCQSIIQHVHIQTQYILLVDCLAAIVKL